MSDDLIRRSDAIEAIHREARLAGGSVAIEYADMFQYAIKDIPSADRPQGEWIDTAISIIDDMQREGIIDYEQAWEFRMRARMKGVSTSVDCFDTCKHAYSEVCDECYKGNKYDAVERRADDE